MADDVLFLAHRIPYPPDKGDKIRSWQFFRHLAATHRVHLGCFVDDPADMAHVPLLERMAASVHIEPIVPWRRKLKSLPALLRGRAMTFTYFHSAQMRNWAQTVATGGLELAFAYSSAMAPYVLDPGLAATRRVVDFVDLDSEKWRLLANERGPVMRAVLRREATALAAAENRIATLADETWLISDAERQDLIARGGKLPERLQTVPNGVDLGVFNPVLKGTRPGAYPSDAPVIVFTGAMDYALNVDAVRWFVTGIWPKIRSERPAARFAIVGARPTAEVLALTDHAGVLVTGRVDDIRPWLGHADLAVAPMRLARGVQNKVLEAMAMGQPMVTTTAGLTGIDGAPVAVAETAKAFAAQCLRLLDHEQERRSLAETGRAFVVQNYDWAGPCGMFDRLLPAPAKPHPAAA